MNINYISILAWSAFLLIGYYGAGEFFLRQLGNRVPVINSWALKITVGLCLTIFFLSVLMVFRQCNYQGIVSISILSFLFGIYFLFKSANEILLADESKKKQTRSNLSKHRGYVLLLVVPGIFTALAFLSSIYWPLQYDPNDDWIAYLTFPELLLNTGTLIDPFSSRRILGLCGQSLLLAQIMVVAPPESAHLLDRGFGVVLLFGLLVEATRQTHPRWQWLRALVILAAVTASVPRINTASSQLGISMIFAFILVVSKLQEQINWSWRETLIPALILAGASSLRPTFAIVGGGILIFFFAGRALCFNHKIITNNLMPLLKVGVFTFAFLAPLMVVSYLSSGTPMFPFFSGNAAPEFIYWNTGKGLFEDAKVALNFMLMPEMIVMGIGMLLIFVLKGTARLLALSVALVAVIMVFINSVKTSGTASSWIMDLYRYGFPIYAVAFYWVLSKALEIGLVGKFLSGPLLAGVMAAVFWTSQIVPAIKEIQIELEVLPLQSTGFEFPTTSLKPYYDHLQNIVPSNEKIFAVVDAPYLLNYERNTIHNVDVVAYASPQPGMPFHQGPEAIRKYLLGLGYHYILAVDFNKAVFLYNRKAMENHPRPEYRDHAKKYVLDFLNNIDALAEKNTIASNQNCRLISLQ